MILSLLYPDNPWLCIGATQNYFNTLTLDYWRGKLADKQFIVPSPMTCQSGITKQGKVSKHTLQNTGPRRYLVLDFDDGTLDQHAAIIWHLAVNYAPLTMVLFSGGRVYTLGLTSTIAPKLRFLNSSNMQFRFGPINVYGRVHNLQDCQMG